MKLLDTNAAAPLVFAADLALLQGRKWFLFRGNRVKFTRDDLIEAPEPFNLMSLYSFTTKYRERMYVQHSFIHAKLLTHIES